MKYITSADKQTEKIVFKDTRYLAACGHGFNALTQKEGTQSQCVTMSRWNQTGGKHVKAGGKHEADTKGKHYDVKQEHLRHTHGILEYSE